jgi:diguanylate cyclase (GGDEF)-like protein
MATAPTDAVLDALQAGVILLDAEGGIIAWNKWLVRHSGLEPGDVLARRLEEVFPEVVGTRLATSIGQALSSRLSAILTPSLNPPYMPLYRLGVDKNHDQRMLQLVYVTPLRHEACACMIQIEDMTANVRRERRLRVHSSQLLAATYLDTLTGVGNRRRFDQNLDEACKQALQKKQSLALLMVDLDNLQPFNERFGQARGDACLAEVAKALQGGLRQLGDQVARYGGDEFTVLLPGADLERACMVAERLRGRVEALHLGAEVDPQGTCVTVSIGVSAFVPGEGQDAHVLISEADLALYLAKDEGRNRSRCYIHASNEILSCG